MSNPVHYERRSTPERRNDQRRRSEPSPGKPPPVPEREPDTTALSMDRLWTVRQAAAFLARSTSWVYKAAERGDLPRARGMGWGLRLVRSELHAYARGEVSGPCAMMRKREGGA
jgi:predicted DNA-binding transcriptional regulator AlpA